MPLFDRFGRRRPKSPANPRTWWEAAVESPPEVLYDSAEGIGSAFDPMGSYTGVPEDGGEPMQDADDL